MIIPPSNEIRSIYADIENRPGLSLDLSGWNSRTPIFDEVIGLTRPRVIIEVGVWNGASVVHMAQCCRRRGLNTVIFAVDVFYGRASDEMSELPPYPIPREWQRPSRYEQFLFNIKKSGFDDMVIPVCNFTRHAAAMLKNWNIVADAIYIDATHDEEGTYQDFRAYWPLLRDQGKMFGDDIVGYVGVLSALGRFCKEESVPLGLVDSQWFIDKPVRKKAA